MTDARKQPPAEGDQQHGCFWPRFHCTPTVYVPRVIMMIIIFSVVAVVRAACPDNAIERAMMCTAGLGFGPAITPNNAFVERGQIELAKQACR